MKTIASIAIVAASLSVSSAHAAEVGLLLDKQIGQSPDFYFADFQRGGKIVSLDSVGLTGFGLRGAFTVLDLKVAELGFAATYHPEAKADLKGDGAKCGTVSTQYIAIGAQVDWKFLVNLHAGVDLRQEKTKTEFGHKSSTTFTRPWVKAGIGFSIPTPIVSPFVRLEAAYALTTYRLGGDFSDDDFNKAMAPKYQIALYGGIRF